MVLILIDTLVMLDHPSRTVCRMKPRGLFFSLIISLIRYARFLALNITIILPHLQFVKVLMIKTIVGNPLLDHVQQRPNVKDLVVKRNFMSEEMYDDFMLEQCLSAKDTTIADKKDANFKSTLSHIFQNLASLTLRMIPNSRVRFCRIFGEPE
jgi:hypothetical protein